MKAIFPSCIDSDWLKLIHLSNGFKVIPGSMPKVGDICHAEARVVAVVNGDAGKTVWVSRHVLCEGDLVIKVQSASRFTDYENTFETIDEPDYAVELATDAGIGVLLSKDWFEWADEAKPLTAGTRLTFCLRSKATYKDKVNYHSVAVTAMSLSVVISVASPSECRSHSNSRCASFNVQQPTVVPPQDQGQSQGNLLEHPVSREGHPIVSGSVSTSSRVCDVGAESQT